MKSFSELTSASQVNNGDLLAISQTSGSGYVSKKTTVKDIADKSNLNLAEEYDSTSTYAVDDYVIYESVLYKCIGTTTGTFDSTKWTSVAVTDEMGSGGGGGTGGHTIIDENGNSMTARAGLQFFGAVEVKDDSANNRTLVEVLGGDFYNPVIYSTTEREIGVWEDGKPLYQKTWVFTSGLTVSYNSWTSSIIDSTDIENIIRVEAIHDDGSCFDGIMADPTNGNHTKVAFQTTRNNASAEIKKLTLQYTKISDTAGSGSWTPSGIPAVHYSTEEQVIGTWMGETLYQKTYHNVSMTNNANNVVDSNFGTDKVLQSFRLDTKGMVNTLFNYSTTLDDTLFVDNGVLKYYLAKKQTWWNALNTVDITIQYTKSS